MPKLASSDSFHQYAHSKRNIISAARYATEISASTMVTVPTYYVMVLQLKSSFTLRPFKWYV